MYSLKQFSYPLFILLFLSCGEAQQEVIETTKVKAENGISYSDSTRQSLQKLLRSYYSLKDALVAADSSKAKDFAVQLASALDTFQTNSDTSLKLSSLTYPSVLKEASVNLSKISALEEQRAVFETISDNLYELVKTLKPSGIETYQQYCPMAFNDKGAYWLSDTSHIQNPYFGKKMLTCGEVKEELRYQ